MTSEQKWSTRSPKKRSSLAMSLSSTMGPDVCSWLSSIICNRRDLHGCRPSLCNAQKAKYKREKKSCILSHYANRRHKQRSERKGSLHYLLATLGGQARAKRTNKHQSCQVARGRKSLVYVYLFVCERQTHGRCIRSYSSMKFTCWTSNISP